MDSRGDRTLERTFEVVVCYCPTMNASDVSKRDFFERLLEVHASTPRAWVYGDFNCRIGADRLNDHISERRPPHWPICHSDGEESCHGLSI